jgi:hypothetical protein
MHLRAGRFSSPPKALEGFEVGHGECYARATAAKRRVGDRVLAEFFYQRDAWIFDPPELLGVRTRDVLSRFCALCGRKRGQELEATYLEQR